MSTAVVMRLNLKGLASPLPTIKIAKAMKDLAPGELVEAFATDPRSVSDVKAWAQSTGNTLVESAQEGASYRFVLKKR